MTISEPPLGLGARLGLPALLAGAQRVLAAATLRHLADAGFPDLRAGDAVGLAVLAWRRLTASELATLLGISKQAVSQGAERLERGGYITRQQDPDDRRRAVLTLTPKGRSAARAVGAARRAVDEELIQRFGEQRLEVLRETLRAVITAVDGPSGQEWPPASAQDPEVSSHVAGDDIVAEEPEGHGDGQHDQADGEGSRVHRAGQRDEDLQELPDEGR